MTTTVRELRPVENAPDPDVVEILEGFLAAAKRGDLVAVSVAAHHRGGEVGTGFTITPQGDGAYLAAPMEKLKMRMLFPREY